MRTVMDVKRDDIGPLDFGIPAEYAEKAQLYAEYMRQEKAKWVVLEIFGRPHLYVLNAHGTYDRARAKETPPVMVFHEDRNAWDQQDDERWM